MSQRLALIATLLALRVWAQQGSQRPSPFPESPWQGGWALPAKSPTLFERQHGPPAEGETVAGGTGNATFFSSKADGALSTSGRRIDTRELVAAHGTYPFGSRVKVTNLANGKSVDVPVGSPTVVTG